MIPPPQKKVFAEIRRLFLAEIRNLNGFSGQKQELFPPINQHSILDGGTRPPRPLYNLSTEYKSLISNSCKNFMWLDQTVLEL